MELFFIGRIRGTAKSWQREAEKNILKYVTKIVDINAPLYYNINSKTKEAY